MTAIMSNFMPYPTKDYELQKIMNYELRIMN